MRANGHGPSPAHRSGAGRLQDRRPVRHVGVGGKIKAPLHRLAIARSEQQLDVLGETNWLTRAGPGRGVIGVRSIRTGRRRRLRATRRQEGLLSFLTESVNLHSCIHDDTRESGDDLLISMVLG
jgi:hypothetical protein